MQYRLELGSCKEAQYFSHQKLEDIEGKVDSSSARGIYRISIAHKRVTKSSSILRQAAKKKSHQNRKPYHEVIIRNQGPPTGLQFIAALSLTLSDQNQSRFAARTRIVAHFPLSNKNITIKSTCTVHPSNNSLTQACNSSSHSSSSMG